MRHPARPAFAAASIVVTSALVVFLSPGGAVAGPRPHVGPHQSFNGLVNGDLGLAQPATINVACFGPIKPGETGHPLSGQTVEIRPATAITMHSGQTGDAATSIVAFFGPPPPASTARPARATKKSTVTFRRYALAKPIPTSIKVPCSGTGQVTFVPFPRTPPSSVAATVPVQYVGQP